MSMPMLLSSLYTDEAIAALRALLDLDQCPALRPGVNCGENGIARRAGFLSAAERDAVRLAMLVLDGKFYLEDEE